MDGVFPLRPFSGEADVARWVRLATELKALDGMGWDLGEERLRSQLTEPDHDPARDRRVVSDPADPDRLIGSAVAWGMDAGRVHGVIHVHPAWRRQGIGRALLTWLRARAREMGGTYLTGSTEDRHAAAQRFLAQQGFAPLRTWVEMRLPPDVTLADPVWPSGFTMRTHAEVRHLPTLLEGMNRGFIGYPDHRDEEEATLAHWLESAHIRPDGLFLAFGPAGTVAGICFAQISAERSAQRGTPTGYIDSLGVVPEHRRHGLGRALLLTGLRWLRTNGQTTIELDTSGENDRALPLYTGVGFAVVRQGFVHKGSVGT